MARRRPDDTHLHAVMAAVQEDAVNTQLAAGFERGFVNSVLFQYYETGRLSEKQVSIVYDLILRKVGAWRP